MYASLSKARRAKVGCTLVTATGITVSSFNGTPTGLDNNCEGVDESTGLLYTLDHVLHSEDNTLVKCAREGLSTLGAKMYVSMSPCLHCAALMIQAGISEVIYSEPYRDTSALDMLREAGVKVRQFQMKGEE